MSSMKPNSNIQFDFDDVVFAFTQVVKLINFVVGGYYLLKNLSAARANRKK
jgi:hypothetical protein